MAVDRGAALGQLLRFALVGLGSNALLYGVYLMLTWHGLGSKLAMTLLYLVGVVQTFVFNKRWTFGHGGQTGRTFWRYVAAYLMGYILQLGLLSLLVERLDWPHQWVMLGLIGLVAVLLFVLQKYWIFRVSPIQVKSAGEQ